MLRSLHVRHFAIVKSLDLDFAHGTTAFTGETGAGKSIMIDALTLALGGRSDASVVRTGEDKCEISAVFSVDGAAEPQDWLRQHDISHEDEELILRRVISAEGRSKAYINGQPFPLQKLRELSEMLVHIHGQHQHQTLLHHQTHRGQLDRFAEHDHLLSDMKQCYQNLQKTQKTINALLEKEHDQDKVRLLEFQIEELASLELQENEVEQLDKEHKLLHHAKDYLQSAGIAMQLLTGEEDLNINQALHQVLQSIQSLPQDNPQVHNIHELINNALIATDEASNELSKLSDRICLDPERLHDVEQRLSALHNAARKYHIDVRQLSQHHQDLLSERQSLQERDSQLATLQEQYEQEKIACEKAAAALHSARKAIAPRLAKAITDIIQQLGMPKGSVSVHMDTLDILHAHGKDRVEYKVCTNPGLAADSLAKIASGGELSRISLAIQMITAQRATTPTLLFDEVDVGIGGATAALVGQLLRQLGARLQVFCVTHQPQVAAYAHQQFRVEKHSQNNQTYSKVLALSSEGRQEEIARMLGGLTITEHSRNSAKELLGLADTIE